MPKVPVTKKWNQRTVGHLISCSNDSESDYPSPDPPPPPPPPLTLHSQLTSILYIHSHLMPILSLHGHLKSTLPLQTGTLLTIESATCHTSKTPKLVFNPETEQGFCLNNQLILTLILLVLSSQTPVIRLEPTRPI